MRPKKIHGKPCQDFSNACKIFVRAKLIVYCGTNCDYACHGYIEPDWQGPARNSFVLVKAPGAATLTAPYTGTEWSVYLGLASNGRTEWVRGYRQIIATVIDKEWDRVVHEERLGVVRCRHSRLA